MKDTRKLIAKEIELGFLRVPVKLLKKFPKTNGKISCIIDAENKELSFNPKYQRIFGLTSFYRSCNASPNDLIEVNMDGDKIELSYIKASDKEKDLSIINESDASEIINISDLSSQAKGNIVEQRIAELILLYGQGLLNVYKPIADIEGIDLVIIKKGVYQPIFIQVKSRFNLRNKNLQIGVKKSGFNPHHTFFVIGAYFDPSRVDIHDHLIFIPTEEFAKKAVVVRDNTENALYVLNCPLDVDYSGKYADYIVRKENLVNKIFEKFQEIEKYLR